MLFVQSSTKNVFGISLSSILINVEYLCYNFMLSINANRGTELSRCLYVVLTLGHMPEINPSPMKSSKSVGDLCRNIG